MATKFEKEIMKCPSCGAKGQFPKFSELNLGNSSASTREHVMSGRAFVFTCPKCGAKKARSYPLTCSDKQNNLIITVLSSGASQAEDYKKAFKRYETIKEKIARDSANGLVSPDLLKTKYRIVSSCQELAEKIRIFEDNLDDRCVELLKFVIVDEALDEDDDLGYADIICTYKRIENGELIFSTRIGGRRLDLNVPAVAYANVEDLFYASALSDPKNSDSYIINAAWADKVTGKLMAL